MTMACLGRPWNEQVFPPCKVCGSAIIEEPALFFGEIVCGQCYKDLENIAHKKPCGSSTVLVFYIMQQARFISKSSSREVPPFLCTLSLEDLRALADWLIDISLTNLLKLK